MLSAGPCSMRLVYMKPQLCYLTNMHACQQMPSRSEHNFDCISRTGTAHVLQVRSQTNSSVHLACSRRRGQAMPKIILQSLMKLVWLVNACPLIGVRAEPTASQLDGAWCLQSLVLKSTALKVVGGQCRVSSADPALTRTWKVVRQMSTGEAPAIQEATWAGPKIGLNGVGVRPLSVCCIEICWSVCGATR